LAPLCRCAPTKTINRQLFPQQLVTCCGWPCLAALHDLPTGIERFVIASAVLLYILRLGQHVSMIFPAPVSFICLRPLASITASTWFAVDQAHPSLFGGCWRWCHPGYGHKLPQLRRVTGQRRCQPRVFRRRYLPMIQLPTNLGWRMPAWLLKIASYLPLWVRP